MKKQIIFIISISLVIGLFSIKNSKGQSNWTTHTNGIFYSGNVGVGANPDLDAKFTIFDSNRRSELLISRPYTGTANTLISNFDLINPSTGDFARTALRYRDGGYQMVQTAYSSQLGQFIAYSLVDFSTRKYEITQGVMDMEFYNSGHVLFNNVGSVGIGVAENETSKLAGVKLGVNGKIVAEEIEVKLFSAWPDFVFNKDYNLLSLNELESYIAQNKHLPNVPKEAEVMENGVNLGEMSAILLQKVEELTLYVIKLNKKNEELTQRIAELE